MGILTHTHRCPDCPSGREWTCYSLLCYWDAQHDRPRLQAQYEWRCEACDLEADKAAFEAWQDSLTQDKEGL